MPVFTEAVREQMSSAALKSIGWSMNAVAKLSPALAGDLALKLFSRPRSRMSSTHHPEVLKTAEQIQYRHSDWDDAVSLFLWRGDGPTVYLAHGWESNTSRWLPFIRALRQSGYQIIGVDAPAHGYSEGQIFNVPLYTTVLEEAFLRYPPDFFIGHSAGGMAGIYHLVKSDPNAFKAVILMAVPYELEDLMDTFRKIVGMNNLVFDGLKNAFDEHFGFPMSDFSIPKFVKELQLPGLVVHDREDTIAPYQGSREIHQNWSGSKLLTTDGLGHSLIADQVVQNVVEYLEVHK